MSLLGTASWPASTAWPVATRARSRSASSTSPAAPASSARRSEALGASVGIEATIRAFEFFSATARTSRMRSGAFARLSSTTRVLGFAPIGASRSSWA